MFHSLSLKDQAFYLTRLIYRDTEIEVFHSNAASLGSALYAQMLAIVDENVKKVKRCHARMLQVQTEEDINDQLLKMPPTDRDEWLDYVLHFNFLSKCRCNWDPPEKMELSSRPESLSVYLLDGHFSECCEKHCVLSDPVMRYINKDIHNRIYTLLCEKLLP